MTKGTSKSREVIKVEITEYLLHEGCSSRGDYYSGYSCLDKTSTVWVEKETNLYSKLLALHTSNKRVLCDRRMISAPIKTCGECKIDTICFPCLTAFICEKCFLDLLLSKTSEENPNQEDRKSD